MGHKLSYKWNLRSPYKWPNKWVTGVITLLRTGRGSRSPPCTPNIFYLKGDAFSKAHHFWYLCWISGVGATNKLGVRSEVSRFFATFPFEDCPNQKYLNPNPFIITVDWLQAGFHIWGLFFSSNSLPWFEVFLVILIISLNQFQLDGSTSLNWDGNIPIMQGILATLQLSKAPNFLLKWESTIYNLYSASIQGRPLLVMNGVKLPYKWVTGVINPIAYSK